jgi:DNA-binding Xre family transcriptional regulator
MRRRYVFADFLDLFYKLIQAPSLSPSCRPSVPRSAALRDTLHRHVASCIRELARRRAVSLNKLADFADISRSHLARILNGESSPSLSTLRRIAAALDTSTRDLLPPSD